MTLYIPSFSLPLTLHGCFSPRQYAPGEEVVLWMNTVGPYHNRQETYDFYTLPFCKGPKKAISHHHESLGENLQGVSLTFSGLDITFMGRLEVEESWEMVFSHVGARRVLRSLPLTPSPLSSFPLALVR